MSTDALESHPDQPTDADRIRRLEGLLGRPMQAGNTITRLRNGDQIFPAMVQAMQAARRSIDLLTFVYWTGQPAQVIGQTLQDKARAGVRVRLVLDFFGARDIDRDLVAGLEDAGVQVLWFRPLSEIPSNGIDIGKRTHRKVCVIDEEIGFVGGVGIAAEWDGNANGPGEWRDSHFRITGPCVDGIRAGFFDDWSTSDFELSTAADEFPEHDRSGPVRAMTILGESEVGPSAVKLLKRVLIEGARSQIRLTTAYFSPNAEMTGWLVDAAERGVDVQVMFPGSEIDKRLPQANGEFAYPELLEAGAKLWSYETTMLHAKILTVDGCIADVGSSNYNDRSIAHDEEIDIVAFDRELTGILDQDFEADLMQCVAVDEDWWAERSIVERLQTGATKLVDGFI